MNYSVKELFILFMIYSFLGWVQEVIRGMVKDKKIVNRGFLIGPYLPIYGFGAILMIIFLRKYVNDPITLFFMSIFLFSSLEYVTSYLMEKLFKARWWDYTKYKYNINGRICIETMIPFGIAGMIVMYFVNPFLFRCLENTPDKILSIMFVTLSIILQIDIIVTYIVMNNIKGTIKKVKKDNTEEITKKVQEVLMQKNFLKKRIIKAFPSLKIK